MKTIILHIVSLKHTYCATGTDPGMVYNRPWNALQQALKRFTTGHGMVYNRLWNGLQQALEWFTTGLEMV